MKKTTEHENFPREIAKSLPFQKMLKEDTVTWKPSKNWLFKNAQKWKNNKKSLIPASPRDVVDHYLSSCSRGAYFFQATLLKFSASTTFRGISASTILDKWYLKDYINN